jgi:hypothetical protein
MPRGLWAQFAAGHLPRTAGGHRVRGVDDQSRYRGSMNRTMGVLRGSRDERDRCGLALAGWLVKARSGFAGQRLAVVRKDGRMGAVPSPVSGGQAAPGDGVGAQFLPLIGQLGLSPLQQEFLRSRWLDQLRWAEGKAASTQRWYRWLRLITITGGVIIPALVGLNIAGTASEGIRWAVFGLGLVVALTAAIEGFFHYGDRWPHYRRLAELLKSEGWQFFQLSGQYAGAAGHADAYPQFAAHVEAIIQRDVEVFFTAVVAGQTQQQDREQRGQDHAAAGSQRQDVLTDPSRDALRDS